MSSAMSRTNSEFGRYVLVSLLLTLGCTTLFMAPVMISAISAHYALSAAGVGTLTTVELICSGVTALGLANYLRTANIARLALIATAGMLLCQALSAVSLALPVFIAVRMLAGLSYGTCYAIACYLASQSPANVRIISAAFITASAVYGGALFFLPPVVAEFGPRGIFAPLAVFALLVLLVVIKVGNLPRHDVPADQPATGRAAARRDLWLLLIMCAVGNGSLQMLWTFSQGAAEAKKFDIHVTAAILSASLLFNIVGCLVAAALNQRAGVSRPLVFGMLGGMASGIIVGASVTVVGFAAGYILYGFACFFVVPYLFAAGAALDDTGRAATLGGGTMYMAGSISPLIGGLIVDHISLGAVGWVAAGGCLIAALCAWVLKESVDKDAAAIQPSGAPVSSL